MIHIEYYIYPTIFFNCNTDICTNDFLIIMKILKNINN